MPTTFTGWTPVGVARTICWPTLIGPLSAVFFSTEISFGADGCRPSTIVVGLNGAGVMELPRAGAPPVGLIGFGVPFAITTGTGCSS